VRHASHASSSPSAADAWQLSPVGELFKHGQDASLIGSAYAVGLHPERVARNLADRYFILLVQKLADWLFPRIAFKAIRLLRHDVLALEILVSETSISHLPRM
jgi:hypothetical protein